MEKIVPSKNLRKELPFDFGDVTRSVLGIASPRLTETAYQVFEGV
jgi:hypothetical protein